MQKLGQIGKMLQMSWEIRKKWAGAGRFMEEWWAGMSYKRSAHLLLKTNQSKN